MKQRIIFSIHAPTSQNLPLCPHPGGDSLISFRSLFTPKVFMKAIDLRRADANPSVDPIMYRRSVCGAFSRSIQLRPWLANREPGLATREPNLPQKFDDQGGKERLLLGKARSSSCLSTMISVSMYLNSIPSF